MTPEERTQFNEMKAFIDGLKRQQVRAPLDPTSQKVLFDDVPVVKTWTSDSDTSNGYLTVRVKGKIYKIMTQA